MSLGSAIIRVSNEWGGGGRGGWMNIILIQILGRVCNSIIMASRGVWLT